MRFHKGVRAACGAATDFINTTSVTVNGLAEYTTYFFQVYAGDNAGFDVNFFTPPPANQTLINRTRTPTREPKRPNTVCRRLTCAFCPCLCLSSLSPRSAGVQPGRDGRDGGLDQVPVGPRIVADGGVPDLRQACDQHARLLDLQLHAAGQHDVDVVHRHGPGLRLVLHLPRQRGHGDRGGQQPGAVHLPDAGGRRPGPAS